MTEFATSDPHFGHINIIGHCNRPFVDVVHMGISIVERWNATVAPTDRVFVLGDASLSLPAAEYWAPMLNGDKYLVPGNHDKCHPMHRKGVETARARYEEAGLTVLPPEVLMTIGGRNWQMSHFPTSDAPGEERHGDSYTEWRPHRIPKVPLLHGHTHSKEKVGPNKQIHVGMDAWDYTPVSFEQIAELV